MRTLLRILDQLSPPQQAHAHCDVPCGVYEPDTMTWAAETCLKLVEKMLGLELPNQTDKKTVLEYHNTVARAVAVKEDYAQICKRELLILWTDYFKPEHLTKWPDLHDKIWKATKQCSVVKRSVSTEECKKLQDMVHEIAELFKATKQS